MNLYEQGIVGDFVCRFIVSEAPLFSALLSSTYNLVALNLERYFQIVHPLLHKTRFTKNKALVIVALVWLIGPLFDWPYFIATSGFWGTECAIVYFWPSPAFQKYFGIAIVIVEFLIPLAIMTYSYARMVAVLRRKAQVMPTDGAVINNQAKMLTRAQKNMFKTFLIVTLVFVFCWCWNQGYYLLYNLGFPFQFNEPFFYFTVAMVFFNCAANPFIYLAKYRDFQRAATKMFSSLMRHVRNVDTAAPT
jgi:hypothetical protein